VNCSPQPPESRSLHEVTNAADYFSRVSDVVREIDSTRDPVRAVELLHESTLRMGAEVSIFASFIRGDASCESYRLLLACDPQWCIQYEQQAWYANDPWLNYAFHHSNRFAALKSPSKRRPALDRPVSRAVRLSFHSHCADSVERRPVAVRRSMPRSSTKGYFESEGYVALKVVARSVAMELHEWWLQDSGTIWSPRRNHRRGPRTARTRTQGHSTKEIARQLATSAGSINSRFQRLNAKLGVANRKAAARLAAEYGLIESKLHSRRRSVGD